MITVTPNSVPSNVDGVREILRMVSDPKASAARLDELHELAEQLNASVEETRKLRAELDADRERHAADSRTLQQRRESFESREQVRSRELQEHEKVLSARQRQIEDMERKNTDAMNERERVLAARENGLADKEQAANEAYAAAMKLKDFWEKRAAALKSALSD